MGRAYVVVLLEDYLMAEPENHTLLLLREIRGAIGTLDNRVDSLDKKVDRNHEDLKRRIENLRQAAFGESVLGRYAAAEVEERLSTIESRLSALEQQR
jgi:chaperonin cofactor prefoldin